MSEIIQKVQKVGGGAPVEVINNDPTTINGISYYKSGKMRMLTIGNGGNRTVNDLTNFINQYVLSDDLPTTRVNSTMQVITVSGSSWSMELGIFVLYDKTTYASSQLKYILYKSGAEIPRDSSSIIGGQIVWFTE